MAALSLFVLIVALCLLAPLYARTSPAPIRSAPISSG